MTRHTDQPAQTQLLLAEARTTARCQHENIIVIHEVNEYNSAPYIVLESGPATDRSTRSPR